MIFPWHLDSVKGHMITASQRNSRGQSHVLLHQVLMCHFMCYLNETFFAHWHFHKDFLIHCPFHIFSGPETVGSGPHLVQHSLGLEVQSRCPFSGSMYSGVRRELNLVHIWSTCGPNLWIPGHQMWATGTHCTLGHRRYILHRYYCIYSRPRKFTPLHQRPN